MSNEGQKSCCYEGRKNQGRRVEGWMKEDMDEGEGKASKHKNRKEQSRP